VLTVATVLARPDTNSYQVVPLATYRDQVVSLERSRRCQGFAQNVSLVTHAASCADHHHEVIAVHEIKVFMRYAWAMVLIVALVVFIFAAGAAGWALGGVSALAVVVIAGVVIRRVRRKLVSRALRRGLHAELRRRYPRQP
jgi:hypothetical protein